ncbi:hypothetical protein LJC47_01440 [Desulfosarcina sp. OttesenSCG-928-B08]|nr:hypothetical protein [Desulfosarcina sp. OttesenSCG-928-B08]
MTLRTCVSPEGRFVWGIHRPRFTADNFRKHDATFVLGALSDGTRCFNTANFPPGAVHEPQADPVFEIPNAFPFRGTTYIGKAWADKRALAPETIGLSELPDVSFFSDYPDEASALRALSRLPRSLRLALATTSTDPRDLCALARMAVSFCEDEAETPWGMRYENRPDGGIRPAVADEALFDAVANNIHLPEKYREVMVLRPGAQGNSELVGEWQGPGTHVVEYLRRNSYIPWGHYAANMASDAVRYRAGDLAPADMTGLRHLYYQRTYTRLARMLNLAVTQTRRPLTEAELEVLRIQIREKLAAGKMLPFNQTLWGWNYGFDYAPTGYRLHGSHQQIHQQYALIPASVVRADGDGNFSAYGAGDQVGEFVRAYRQKTGKGFFECYENAIVNNTRTDGNADGPASLVVFEDDQVMVFVPKAQTSQWEVQILPKAPVGHIVEADTAMRWALDRAIGMAITALAGLGARMVTCIEYPKSLDDPDTDQRLLMTFMPRLPESPGTFSEAQLRWITGYYPEDVALACRSRLTGKD